MKIDVEALLGVLRRAKGKGASLKALASQVGGASRRELHETLQGLLADGRITSDGHHYKARADGPHRKQEKQPHQDGEARGEEQGHKRKQREAAIPSSGPAALLEGARLRAEQKSLGFVAPAGAKGWGEKRAPAAAKPPPRNRGELVGPLLLKSEGYGFVAPLFGGPREDDVFVPPGQTGGALDGDVVRVRLARGRDGRTVGEVIEIVEHRRQMALGAYRVRGSRAVIEPHDRRMTDAIPVEKDARYHDGELVKVRLLRDGAHGTLRGVITGALGPRGEARFEILAAAYAQGFSDEFDAAVQLAAETIPDHVLPEERAPRRDLRNLPLVTIDGEDARDFDDAVYVSRSGKGYRLVVAIADVAHYVQPGGPLDREALHRSTSVYFPGTVLPMLPERLSNGICSLNPDVERLCMVCDLALDEAGHPLQADLFPAVMRSHGRLTYTQVAEALEGNCPPRLQPLLPDLLVAGELAKKLTGLRRERGSIDFALAEPKIVLREDGSVEDIVLRPRNDAHRLVEEFMLAANEAVARYFSVRGLPTLYRIHDQPDPEKLETFSAMASTHGHLLPEKLTPKALNTFLEQLEGTPAQKALNSLLLRAMMQAQYSPDDIGHYGLAAPTYLHFTSPIRRYPDLVVHRLLHQLWERGGQLGPAQQDEEETQLAGIAAHCSERERASMKAERDVDHFYAAVFMQDKVGEEFTGVVSGVAEPGLFCELDTPSVEGLIPAESLGDDVDLDPELHRLVVGRSGASFGVGDAVRVRLDSSDPVRRRITFTLLEKLDGKLGAVAQKQKAAPAASEAGGASAPAVEQQAAHGRREKHGGRSRRRRRGRRTSTAPRSRRAAPTSRSSPTSSSKDGSATTSRGSTSGARESGCAPTTSTPARARSRGSCRRRLAGLPGLVRGRRLARSLVVEEDQAAVDERPEEGVPADADLPVERLLGGGEADLVGIALLRHREEVVRASVVEDAPVVGRHLLGHGAVLYRRRPARSRRPAFR
jgi:ribonuclease R